MIKAKTPRLSRRDVLKASSAAAATLLTAKALFPSGAHAQAAGPEVTGTKLGYIALTDSAPLIIAKEKGLFEKHGVPDILVEKQASWAATRDNMVLGSGAGGIDGGHILRPKVHLYSSGAVMQNSQKLPMYTLLNISEDCQGISVAQAYKDTGVGLDEGRLYQEAAILATRADVEEELKRLAAHIAGARELVVSREPAGRRLDFLAQEFNREANTLCSKAGDPETTRAGLELKAVIDQMREQVQNIE